MSGRYYVCFNCTLLPCLIIVSIPMRPMCACRTRWWTTPIKTHINSLYCIFTAFYFLPSRRMCQWMRRTKRSPHIISVTFLSPLLPMFHIDKNASQAPLVVCEWFTVNLPSCYCSLLLSRSLRWWIQRTRHFLIACGHWARRLVICFPVNSFHNSMFSEAVYVYFAAAAAPTSGALRVIFLLISSAR